MAFLLSGFSGWTPQVKDIYTALVKLVATLPNAVPIAVDRAFREVTAAIPTSAATRAYSIKSWPDSS
jgi:hypothetical protein